MTLYIKNYNIQEGFFHALQLTQYKVESIINLH